MISRIERVSHPNSLQGTANDIHAVAKAPTFSAVDNFAPTRHPTDMVTAQAEPFFLKLIELMALIH